MNCLYIRKRTKNYKPYFYCTKYKKEVDIYCYRECDDKEYKKTSIKKVSKKRITVSKEIYNTTLSECDYKCALCGSYMFLELHHIIYRSENKKLIDDPNNCIMLCSTCHKLVHSNKKKYQSLLKDYKKNLQQM